jgi:hypothetical protein
VLKFAIFLDLFDDFQAGDIGEHDVEEDKVGTVKAGLSETLTPGRGLHYFVAALAENRARQEEKLRIVVDNEYFGLVLYFLPPRTTMSDYPTRIPTRGCKACVPAHN